MAKTAKIVNNFSIKIATENGTGSQSANNILFKSLVRMGIPTSSKNLFPSNIQGLPTWFVIRTSPKGYMTMRRTSNILVLVNRKSIEQDFKEIIEGTVVLYDSAKIQIPEEVKGAIYYPIPFSKLAKGFAKPRLRTLLTNTIYAGAIAALYNIDREIVYSVIKDTFAKKPKVVNVNIEAVDLGFNYVKENIQKHESDPYTYEKDNKMSDMIIVEGNQASALGCLMGGASVAAWYPITPASSLTENIEKYASTTRKDPKTGKNNIAVIQAEDEIAAIGMAVGAAWAGARAVTGTSGPGISLMSEIIGLAYYAEIPVVICNVQRTGPSTGMPTRTQQADIQMCAYASHGDTKHVCIYPGTVEEAFELTAESFDIAEQIQTPVFVLTDLELGMNLWLSKPFKYYDKPYKRGKVLDAKALEKAKEFSRYLDKDGDGICYRTVPGTAHNNAAYFTRGTSHDEHANYTENHDVYRRVIKRIAKKIDHCQKYLPKPVVSGNKNAKVGIITVGTTHFATLEAIDDLVKYNKVETKYLRVRAFPFHKEIREFIESCDKVVIIEQNRDAQLAGMIKLEYQDLIPKISNLAYSDGLPIGPGIISKKVLEAVNNG